MSDASQRPGQSQKKTGPEEKEPSKGPNLVLVYLILVFGLLLAAGIAAMVVWPFYARR